MFFESALRSLIESQVARSSLTICGMMRVDVSESVHVHAVVVNEELILWGWALSAAPR